MERKGEYKNNSGNKIGNKTWVLCRFGDEGGRAWWSQEIGPGFNLPKLVNGKWFMNWNCGAKIIKTKRNIEVIGKNGKNWWNEMLEEMGNSIDRIILVAFSVMRDTNYMIRYK